MKYTNRTDWTKKARLRNWLPRCPLLLAGQTAKAANTPVQWQTHKTYLLDQKTRERIELTTTNDWTSDIFYICLYAKKVEHGRLKWYLAGMPPVSQSWVAEITRLLASTVKQAAPTRVFEPRTYRMWREVCSFHWVSISVDLLCIKLYIDRESNARCPIDRRAFYH